ncbi:IS1182 family transposase [Hymenobacter volaticus]|uniref:IS1182 family transposase n=1 Tax=Hymenobacter volaticus TaxID=2932254 RepID=A0ABY4GF25_9BACT|nr:IS1182 family transposase [Hymenobacter volaticus]UOQ69109.1 IS1182 family transposase [Hymenobacter volaticus]
MLGFHTIQTSLVKLVPAGHFYQQLLQAVDFSFVRPLFAPFYSAGGRPSLDPVVFVKLLLVGHLENITSDRKLLELAQLHLGIRAFLGYDLAHPLPWHSTVSRTRQRLPVSVFEACFTHIVGLCIQQGLVEGHTQVVDSAYIKANASMSRLQPKRSRGAAEAGTPRGDGQAPRITATPGRLKHIQRFHAAIRKAAPKKAGKLVSNLTHYSPSDPEARIAFKSGKARVLAYTASVSVDTAQHVITHISADLADWRDSRYLLAIVDATQQRLNSFRLFITNVVADAGYCSGENYEQREERGLTGYIPAHGGYKGEHPGFLYDAVTDSYTCGQGKQLVFDQVYVDAQGNAKKRYLAKARECKVCPLAEQCKGKKAKEKRLHHTPYKAHYDRMLARLATRVGQRMRRLRASTVEPVLGSLITYYGLRHLSKKRQAGAAKVLYVAAMAYNLKKYLRFNPFQPGGLGIALPAPAPFRWLLLYFCNSHSTSRTTFYFTGYSRAHFPSWRIALDAGK